MSTFAQPRPLAERIIDALAALNTARQEGHQPLIEAAERVLNGLLDRQPRWRPLHLIDPELDAHLRVTMR
ncbi:hypothetical protein [Mycolicibacterium sp.]|uniref:hypothetical protein n=1 Tax=Mycolicibacterium sp. TaxID=2320850 RepID=UPI0037CC9458